MDPGDHLAFIQWVPVLLFRTVKNVQMDPGDHLASYSVGTRTTFPDGIAAVAKG